jgi:hypothetical protein
MWLNPHVLQDFHIRPFTLNRTAMDMRCNQYFERPNLHNRNKMIKKLIPLIFIIWLIGCRHSTELADYFGQPYPDSIPVIFAPDIVSIKGRFEHGISFTPDTREFAFGILNKDDFSGTIYYSNKIKNTWTEPGVFEPLQNESVYLPYFSPDGKLLLYAQSKPDTNNGFTDIWIIKKTNDNWSNPEILPVPINSVTREANASMTFDGTIYFSSVYNLIKVGRWNIQQHPYRAD